MKAKIKVKLLNENCKPLMSDNGEAIDLRSAINVKMKAPQYRNRRKLVDENDGKYFRDVDVETCLIPLGVAIQLPAGYKADVKPRSSTPIKFNVICANSIGLIDNSYCGDNDEWKFNALAFGQSDIREGDRICQFEISLSQKATIWQRIKWLFTNGVELEFVDSLDNEDRGGHGTSGVK